MNYELDILIPVSFPENIRRVLDSISLLFGEDNIQLHLLHVTNFQEAYLLPNTMWVDVQKLQQDLLSGLAEEMIRVVEYVKTRKFKVKSTVTQGNIVDEIKVYCDEHLINLIAMPTHARKGISHLVLGSVTEKVIRSLSVPVLSVQPYPEKPIKR